MTTTMNRTITNAVFTDATASGVAEADRIVQRAVEDAVTAAWPVFWWRRAALFEWARPRRGDFAGLASVADVQARDRRLAGMAAACRRHAQLVADARPWWLASALLDEGVAG